ncbi:MAG: deoxyribose-phosphate aldolase [Mycoplasmoidaceae bacterium]|nr:deoxyribose-phosphate aldolase [Mycoplasmoidaceae bacterium]
MELNKYIDHTLLRPDAAENEIRKLCEEAKLYKFASVCVNPYYIPFCKQILDGTDVKVCTVIGFPLGQMTTKAKCDETTDAIMKGAKEIDMVLNIAALKQEKLDYVTDEIKQIAEICHSHQAILKVIIETCLLNEHNKIDACQCVSNAGADFIKTSTGFSTAGATVADVALMKKYVDPKVKIKAAGGIRNKADAIAFIEAGASRLGTSKGVSLIADK